MWITIVVTTPHHKHVGEASMNIVDSLVLLHANFRRARLCCRDLTRPLRQA